MLLEVFTKETDESDAIFAMQHLATNLAGSGAAKSLLRRVLGERGVSVLRRLLGR